MTAKAGPILLWLCALGLLPAAAANATPPIVQLPGTAGCVTEDGTGGECADGVALLGPNGLAASADGRNVYVATSSSDAIAVFDRNASTGALTQKAGLAGCISDTGTGGLCTNGFELDGPRGIAVSSDGRNVYATATTSDSVLVYDRDPATGALLLKVDIEGCVSDDGSGDQCVDGNALNSPWAVAVSPDGRNVYVASSSSSALAVFDRAASGVLTQKAGNSGCVSDGGVGGCTAGVAMFGVRSVAVSADGRNVYAGAFGDDSVVVFDRDTSTGVLTQKSGTDGCVSETGTGGECINGVALDGVNDVALTEDGRNAYVTTGVSNALVVFDRNLTTGVLTQKAGLAGCVSSDGTSGACTQGVALANVGRLAPSADGTSVYLGVGGINNGVAVFDRNVATGVLTQKAGVAACVTETGSGGACEDGKALLHAFAVAVTADGRNVYTASDDSQGVAAFRRDVPAYDVDGDGEQSPLTDGLLLLRYQFGFTGATLVLGAVDLVNCTRCTAPAIEAFLTALSAQ